MAISASDAVCANPEPKTPDGLRERILAVAVRMFAQRGFAATSTREVVEAAGCTKPALYYHFTNKEGLFREAVAAARARLDRVDAEACCGNGSFRLGLLRAFELLGEQVANRPDDIRLLFRAEAMSWDDSDLVDTRSVRRAHLDLVEQMIRQGVTAGELRADLPVEHAAIALVGALHFQLQLWLDGHGLAPDFGERILGIYLQGAGR
ncbi:MAG: TetR/AcrR family transcriptional regulator [Deltaproteobacteria bacterium]|nr:TetR/AcrR family transcriptional regulator [Deltaproteobacteria bacterium]